MVQNSTAPSRRDSSRRRRRREVLKAARAVIGRHGLGGLTVKAVADEVDCAVGSIYNSFTSKDALVAALQADAIASLGRAYDLAVPAIDERLSGLDPATVALGRVVGFARLLVAAETVYPDDFHLQQQLLATPGGIADPAEAERVVPVAFGVLDRPRALLDDAVQRGALQPGDSFDRMIVLVSALNGVLLLGSLSHPGAGLFDTALLAGQLTSDLLAGWGADRSALARVDAALPQAEVAALLPVPVPEEDPLS